MVHKPITVVHYRSRFLGVTEGWIYDQVTGLEDVETRFYAFSRANRDRFPLGNLRCLQEALPSLPQRINRACTLIFHRCPQFMRWFRADRPDLIHAHFGRDGYHMLPYVRRFKVPLVTSFYGYDAYQLPQKRPWWRWRYKKLFRQGRLFLAEGPVMREKLVRLGCPPDKIVVHHIGIKLGEYDFRPRRPSGEVRLMVCGRFVEKKGIPHAVEALARVISRTGAAVRLTIVGDSDSEGTVTDEKRGILNAIERCGVSDAVTITGYVPHSEVMKIACDHHIFLAPSVHAPDGDAEGGFPVIITEVLATGMPVVAFSHCDIPHIIQDGKSGFLVPEGNVEALADKISYLVDRPGLWREMASCGREFVEEHYDIKKLNKRLVGIYRDLVTASP